MKLHRVDIICGNSGGPAGAMPTSGPLEYQLRELASFKSRLQVGIGSSGVTKKTSVVWSHIIYMALVGEWRQSA